MRDPRLMLPRGDLRNPSRAVGTFAPNTGKVKLDSAKYEARVGIDGCRPQFCAILIPLLRAGEHKSASKPKPAFHYPFADSFTDSYFCVRESSSVQAGLPVFTKSSFKLPDGVMRAVPVSVVPAGNFPFVGTISRLCSITGLFPGHIVRTSHTSEHSRAIRLQFQAFHVVISAPTANEW